jgi:predicted dehydrogenase
MNDPLRELIANAQTTSRRSFMKTALTTGFSLAAASQFGCTQSAERRKAGAQPPPPLTETEGETEEKAEEVAAPQFPDVRLAFIGTGGMGGTHIEELTKHGVKCPCYCDVDTERYKKAAEAFPDAKAYQDYREMLDKEHKNFDAVMIGVPDHHHFPATMIAMQLGKHVYTQKPLTHTVWEARQLAAAAKRYKVATQMGNQGHANEGWRLIYEWIHSGALGQVKEVHSWTDRPVKYWAQGMERPEGEDEVPANLNWDVWLGPAPERPFKDKVYHPFVWRGWWDFGAGALGDMACHTMDGMFWAMEPTYPTAVEPVAMTPMNGESFPNAAMVKWEFPAHQGRPAWTGYWYDGGLLPTLPPELELGRTIAPLGNLFIGTKATILVQGAYGDSVRIVPESKMKAIGKPKPLLERSPGHYVEWLLAVSGQKPLDYPKSRFAYAAPMTESILLGNIALRMGRRLEWDGANMRFKNVPDADQYVTKEYRAGWKIV